jgi:hypothetical protein
MSDNKQVDYHLSSFVKSFVEKKRQERWLHFLCNRPKKTYKHSAKLLNHLDERYYKEVDNIECIPDDASGVFFDFWDSPKIIKFNEAFDKGMNEDAIFSYKPGKLAIYFFHEGWIFLCENRKF